MKKHSFIFFVFLVSSIAFSSCTTVKASVWDRSIPKENLCEIYFLSGYIHTYNGLSVAGKKGWYDGSFFRMSTIKIPAGSSGFSGKFLYSSGGTTFDVDGIEFNYFFEAGKRYTVFLNRRGRDWGLDICEGIKSSKYKFKDKDLIATIPLDIRREL
jgi:hypothetical protein